MRMPFIFRIVDTWRRGIVDIWQQEPDLWPTSKRPTSFLANQYQEDKVTIFKEYDVVQNDCDIDNIPKNSLGTILMIHDQENGFYEVEFINNGHNTIGIVTVSGSKLRKADDQEN